MRQIKSLMKRASVASAVLALCIAIGVGQSAQADYPPFGGPGGPPSEWVYKICNYVYWPVGAIVGIVIIEQRMEICSYYDGDWELIGFTMTIA